MTLKDYETRIQEIKARTIADAVRELDAREPGLGHAEAARRLSAELRRPVSKQAVHAARKPLLGTPPGRRHGSLRGGIAVRLPERLARYYAAEAKRAGSSIRETVLAVLRRGAPGHGPQ